MRTRQSSADSWNLWRSWPWRKSVKKFEQPTRAQSWMRAKNWDREATAKIFLKLVGTSRFSSYAASYKMGSLCCAGSGFRLRFATTGIYLVFETADYYLAQAGADYKIHRSRGQSMGLRSLSVVLLCASLSFAQSVTSLRGRVTDPSHSIVQGAQV